WGLHEQPAVSGYWRPVPTLLYLLTGQIFGKSAWAFHALNLGFHVAVGVSLARLLLLLGFEPLPTLFASLFFVLNPLHAESVSFVSALPDLAAAFFGLQMVRLWLVGTRTSAIWGGVCLSLALLTKESSVIFPVVWFVLAVSGATGPNRLTGLVSRVSCGVVLICAYVIAHGLVTGGIESRSAWGGTWDAHLGTVVKLLPFSFALCIFPWSTTPTRTFDLARGVGDPQVWLSLLTVAVLTLLWRFLKRRESKIQVGFPLFFLFWLPVSNLVPAEGLIADRYLYLAAAGTSILWGGLIAALAARIRTRRVSSGAITLVFLLWGAWAFRAALPWRSELSLWDHATRVSPTSPLAWNERGKMFLGAGEWKAARDDFERALSLRPGYREATLNVVVSDLDSGDLPEARMLLEEFLARSPGDPEAWDLRSALAEREGDLESSRAFAERAASLAPGEWKYQYNLGTICLKTNRVEEAVRALESAAKRASYRPGLLLNLGAAYYAAGALRKAAGVYREILRRDPRHRQAAENLRIVEERLKRGKGSAR
ncbi:MAG: tetratricopeptide repeat protein, partial [Pseudomonadota bacterium]